ncbi:MAG: carboxymethylenebutenolidase [Granulosicoccus sp.]|nr:carboxymethylenebutenolidase [Granulosicoccus sp.]
MRTESIEYQHDGITLEALLAWDDQITGPRPGVLISHAWAGRSSFENARAEDLAAMGYAGFALDLYGKGVSGSSKEENSALMQPFISDRPHLLNRLQQSLDTLKACAVVDESRTAIMGYCFGGLCALDLARGGADIQGAISIHGLLNAPELTGSMTAKILALHGWDDPMVPPEQVLDFNREMTSAGADWQLHAYGNTMHAFTNPQADDPGFGTLYNADADRRSRAAIRFFLSEVLD